MKASVRCPPFRVSRIQRGQLVLPLPAERVGVRTSVYSAYMIIETMVYIGILFVLIGAISLASYRCMDRSLALRRNVSDLTAALQAGERWRADIRASDSQIKVESDRSSFYLPSAHGEIIYRFETNSVWRRSGSNSWSQLLVNVKSSRMEPDPRKNATAWRWDLELQPYRRDTSNTNRVRPLFTFLAVPQTGSVK